MTSARAYLVGQRWEFKSDVTEFEKTLVIGRVLEADPESDRDEAMYEVYVRFAPVAEKAIGAKLPDDFKESVQLHDGGAGSIPPYYGELLSLDRILESWRMYQSWQQDGEYAVGGDDWVPREVQGPIKPVWWDLKRIYITDNSGDHLTLDLDPPEDGVYGQILEHSHEVGPVRVVAPSWSEFLRQLVDDLEAGKYVYFEDAESLEPLESQQ